MKDQIKIVDFYKDKDIFITGGLGHMGKVLIEKLLRSCPDLRRIFILVRAKKNKSVEDRLEILLKSSLFDPLRSQNPNFFSKIIPINGDITLPGLGISSEDFELIKNVSIFFHSAATTRFTEPICKAVLINVSGTYHIMELCTKLKNIVAVVHISTTFCNLDRKVLEEKIYPPYADWREIIELAKQGDVTTLEENFVKKHTDNNHNSYTLTKHLAERVANDYKDKLPIVVFRPSIVHSIISEPIPGWTDTISGPMAFFTGYGTGLIRTHFVNTKNHGEFIAVDVAIKAFIVAAYKKGIDQSKNEITVYNCSKKLSRPEVENLSKELIKIHPFEKGLWNPSLSKTTCKYYFLICFVIFQIIPAILVDTIMVIIRKKPFLYQLQLKVYKFADAYKPFMLNIYDFQSENIYHLDRFVLPEELFNDIFAFNHFHKDDLKNYYEISIRGFKKYMLKEPEFSTNGAKIRAKMLNVLDLIVKSIFYFYVIRWLYRLDIVKNIFDN